MICLMISMINLFSKLLDYRLSLMILHQDDDLLNFCGVYKGKDCRFSPLLSYLYAARLLRMREIVSASRRAVQRADKIDSDSDRRSASLVKSHEIARRVYYAERNVADRCRRAMFVSPRNNDRLRRNYPVKMQTVASA